MITTVLAEASGVVRRAPGVFFGVLLVAYVPIEVVLAVVEANRPLSLTEYFRVERAISFIVGTLIAIILANAVHTLKRQDGSSAASLFRSASATWPHALWVVFLVQVGLVVSFILLVVPAFVFLTFFSFALYAAALRNQRGFKALSYSWQLVRGRAWRVFGWLVAIAVVIYFPILVLMVVYVFAPEHAVVDLAVSVVIRLLDGFHTLAMVCLFLALENRMLPDEPVPEIGGQPA